MAVEGSSEDHWQSVDQLLGDLLQDPTVLALINGDPSPQDAPSPGFESASPSTSNSVTSSWRPWCELVEADSPSDLHGYSRPLAHHEAAGGYDMMATLPQYGSSYDTSGYFLGTNSHQQDPMYMTSMNRYHPMTSRPGFLPLNNCPWPSDPQTTPSDPRACLSAPLVGGSPSCLSPGSQASLSPAGWSSPSPVISSPLTPVHSPLTPPSPSPSPCQHLIGVEVTLTANLSNMRLYGKRGVIQSVSEHGIATVLLYDTYQQVRIGSGYCLPVKPRLSDKVKVLIGCMQGSKGTLVGLAGESAIVEFYTYNKQGQPVTSQLVQIGLNYLGKYRTQAGISAPRICHRSLTHCTSPLSNVHSSLKIGFPAPASKGLIGLPSKPVPATQKIKPNVIVGVPGGSSSHKPLMRSTWELLEEIIKKPSPEFKFTCLGDSSDVKASCVRVCLICPLSQKRMMYPCRGVHCKHLQCFDAEAFIDFNKSQKRKWKVKNGGTTIQPMQDNKWRCPLCHNYTLYSHLYIDKTLLKLARETTVMEVEFDQDGSWKPVEKATEHEVIDLTLDDSEEEEEEEVV